MLLLSQEKSFLEIIDDLRLTPGSISQLPLQNTVARTRTFGLDKFTSLPRISSVLKLNRSRNGIV